MAMTRVNCKCKKCGRVVDYDLKGQPCKICLINLDIDKLKKKRKKEQEKNSTKFHPAVEAALGWQK